MKIELFGTTQNLIVNRNGDGLASFYHCKGCGELLAVGCDIDGRVLGAVNALLLDQKDSLGKPVRIQPKLLSAGEKLLRWRELWGSLSGVPDVV
jgi:hypothetical protein